MLLVQKLKGQQLPDESLTQTVHAQGEPGVDEIRIQ